MGLALEMAFRIRKIVVISIRTSYRSVRKYPFLVGLLCFLILLYKSCPFLFSLLVSASPVLICTAVLLGTLLSFGQPNIPEIQTEEKVSYDVASFRSGILENDTVVAAEDENFTVERFTENKVENFVMETGFSKDGKTSKLDDHGALIDVDPMIHQSDREIQFDFERVEVEKLDDKGEVEKAAERELHSLELKKSGQVYGEDLDIKGLAMDGENAVENQGTRNESLESENGNILIETVHKEDPGHLSTDDNDENDYDSSDSGSDGAESSSPDASMADIIPMLDELHPLLDSEAPLPSQRSNEDSDAFSEQSHKSDGECVMSDDDDDDDGVNQGEEGGAVYNDDDDDDDDEGMQEEKEDESKSAIKWTEDDQKNLMDLGTLELERNQRLENLIARRRARNNLRMLAGKNLIDLDGFELPANVPPISTARRNPFDLPYDSYDNLGLPPIPGSAPSILLPRRNPFDLPYDPNEEKPDLKGDGFEQEFLTSQQKDAFFRRHESFSQPPSSYVLFKQEQHDIRWKPYFTMPEKVASEGTSYSPLERQLSEVSETKLSSVSDTESMSSTADQDDKKPNESQSYLETSPVSYLDHATIQLEHGDRTWEDINSEEFVQVESRDVHHEVIEITLGSTESHLESNSGLSEIGAADSDLNASEIHPNNEVAETDYSSNSSLSSLSEVNEKPFEKKSEVKPGSSHVEESGTSMQPSLGDADFKMELDAGEIHPKSVVADIDDSSNSSLSSLSEVTEKPFEVRTDAVKSNSSQIEESDTSMQPALEEPVYDSSPSAEGKFSFSPDSSVIHEEITNMHSPHSADTMDHFSGKESEVHSEIGQDDTSGFKDMHAASSEMYALDRNEQEPGEVSEVIKHEVIKVESSKINTNTDAQSSTVDTEVVVGDVPITCSLSSDVGSIEKGTVDDRNSDKDYPSSHEAETVYGIHQIEDEKMDSSPSSDQMSSRSLTFIEPEDQLSTVVSHVSAHTVSPSDAQPVEMHETLNDEERSELERERIYTSDSSDSSSEVEIILQNDAICHTEQVLASTSNHGSEIPAQDLHDMAAMNTSLATSHEHLPATLATFSGPHEQNSTVVGEQIEISTSSSFPHSGLELVEEYSINEKEAGSFEQDSVQSSSIKSQTGSEVQQDVDIKIASSGSSHHNMSPEVIITSANKLEQAWSDKTMVDPSLDTDTLLTDSGAEIINSENITPKVHEAISTGLSSTSVSSDNPDFKSPDTGGNPKDGIVDTVSEDHEEVSKHLDSLAEAYGSQFSERTMKEEVDETAEIDEALLSELDEIGDFGVKEVGKPSIEKITTEEAQTERTDSSSSNLTETKPELPVLEARSFDDINLAFKQLQEGVDVEEVILLSTIEDQAKEASKAETNSDLEVVNARSLGDIHVALMQLSENNSSELPTDPVSNDQSVGAEQSGTVSTVEIASSNVTAADKPASIIDEKSVHPNVTISNTEEKKKKADDSKSGSSSSSSDSD